MVSTTELSPSTQVTDRKPPIILGNGIDSLTGRVLRAFAEGDARDDYIPGTPVSIIHLIKDKEDFSRSVDISVQASFNLAAGSGGMSASWCSQYKRSLTRVDLLLRKRVERFVWDYSKRPKTVDDMSGLTKEQILRFYGDEIITRVKTGGELMIWYSFDFKSFEDAEAFKLSGNYNSSGANVSGSFRQAIKSATSSLQIDAKIICIGALDGPPLLDQTYKIKPDRSKGEKSTSELGDGVSALIEYFNIFESKVQIADANVPIAYESTTIDYAIGAEGKTSDVVARRNAIVLAAEINDEIENRISIADYMRNSAIRWNNVSIESVVHIQESLNAAKVALHNKVRAIALNPSESLDIPAIDSLAEIPTNWKIRGPVAIFRKKYSRLKSNDVYQSWDIPPHLDGEPYKVILEFEIYKDGTKEEGAFGLSLVLKSGSKRRVAREKVDFERKGKIEKIIYLPQDATAIEVWFSIGAGATVWAYYYDGI